MKKRISDLISTKYGFSIIELIVIITIIGILAAVTFVTYSGLQSKASDTSVLADIDNMDGLQTSYGIKNNVAGKAYYSSSGTDVALGFTPSSGNVIDVVINSNDYCIRGYNLGGTKKTIFNAYIRESTVGICTTLSPSETAIVAAASQIIAPHNPVADWLALTQGDHYGNYYDLVTKSWATVTRAASTGAPTGTTGKTIYDPNTQKIYDVPENKLAINPRSDGKSGSEAVIEESRRNYLTNSYNLTGWGEISSTSSDAVYSNTSSVVNVPNGSWTTVQSPYISISPNTTYTLSAYIKHDTVGKNEAARIYQYDSSYVIIGEQTQGSASVTSNLSWQRVSVTITSAANAAYFRLNFPGSQGPYVYYISAAQLEIGSFATSYIPTTTAAVTRNADVVTVPTTNWGSTTGTLFAVRKVDGLLSQSYILSALKVSGANIGRLSINDQSYSGPSYRGVIQRGNDGDTMNSAYGPYMTPAVLGTYKTLAARYTSNGFLKVYEDGSNASGSTNSVLDAASNLGSLAYVGSFAGGSSFHNQPISRFSVYSSALSDANVLTVSDAIKDGPY